MTVEREAILRLRVEGGSQNAKAFRDVASGAEAADKATKSMGQTGSQTFRLMETQARSITEGMRKYTAEAERFAQAEFNRMKQDAKAFRAQSGGGRGAGGSAGSGSGVEGDLAMGKSLVVAHA